MNSLPSWPGAGRSPVVQDRHQPVGVDRGRQHPAVGVDHLHPYVVAGDRERVGQRARVGQLGHRLGGLARLGVGGAVDGLAEHADQHDAADEQAGGEPGDAEDHQPGAQAQPLPQPALLHVASR